MVNTAFYGQQDGERILYEARPQKFGMYVSLAQVGLGLLGLVVILSVVSVNFPEIGGVALFIGLILGLALAVSAVWTIVSQSTKNVTFITDRRVIRFMASAPWMVTSRSLFWDEVVKIKTFSPSWLKRTRNIGSVVVHARTNTLPGPENRDVVTSDDLLISDVSYYIDLGNYMDKILYLYKQRKEEELAALRPFIAKPKGQRY